MNLHPCPHVRSDGTDPAQTLVAIPYLVGYFPADSLVCLMLDAQDRIVVTARLDWLPAAQAPGSAALEAVTRSVPSGASRAMVVAVQPKAQGWHRAISQLVHHFDALGADIAWSGWMSDEHWQSSRCTASGCLPHELPDPSTSDLVLQLIVAGAAPAATRDEVVAELAPVPASRRLAGPFEPQGELERWRDEAVERVMGIVAADAPVDAAAVRVLAAAMADIRVRDTVLHRITTAEPPGSAGAWEAVWRVATSAMRQVPRRHMAPLAAVAALAAWQLGDGLRAGEALVRAREADPQHSLTRLLQRALDEGLVPSTWSVVMSGLTEGDCRYGRNHDTAA